MCQKWWYKPHDHSLGGRDRITSLKLGVHSEALFKGMKERQMEGGKEGKERRTETETDMQAVSYILNFNLCP